MGGLLLFCFNFSRLSGMFNKKSLGSADLEQLQDLGRKTADVAVLLLVQSCPRPVLKLSLQGLVLLANNVWFCPLCLPLLSVSSRAAQTG